MVKEIRGAFITYDVHTHPTEIMSDILEYREDAKLKGIFALGEGKYSGPSLGKVKPNLFSNERNYSKNEYHRILPMFLKKIYFYTGPKVFGDYFDIAGIDKALLLPVAHSLGSLNKQMAISYKMFNHDPGFGMAGSVPNEIRNDQIESFLRRQIEDYKIVAIKIHPNVSGIDLGIPEGKERIECIIEAGEQLGLPIIIHGGRNDWLNQQNNEYATIKNLREIDFTSSTPIIIAHGGAYDMSLSEVISDVLPSLKKLLEVYENLSIDISGLNHEIISKFLATVDTGRILFGSDALYENPIIMILRLLHALEETDCLSEDSLIAILSKNAAEKVFRENPVKNGRN